MVAIAIAALYATLSCVAVVLLVLLCAKRKQPTASPQQLRAVSSRDTSASFADFAVADNTPDTEQLYERVNLSAAQKASSMKTTYVAIEQMDKLMNKPRSEPLYVMLPAPNGQQLYAEVSFENAVTSHQVLFRCVVEDVEEDSSAMIYAHSAPPGAAQSQPTQQNPPPRQQPVATPSSPSDDSAEGHDSSVYGNAESIVKSLAISPSELVLGDVIGTGAFGDVIAAKWYTKGAELAVKVAVKRVKLSADSEQAKQAFLKEMSTISQLTHNHIVQVLGVTLDPPLIVLEFIAGGNVHNWLNTSTHAPPLLTLLTVAQQTCSGLAYLAGRHVVHRDVAARNVLIRFMDNYKFICKLTDFGLSQIFDSVKKESALTSPIPVRWTAPEGLFFSSFSERSDVWSFGVLLWELLTCCRVFPYEAFYDELELVTSIEAGLRLERPSRATDSIYDLLLRCWQLEPENRPRFETILLEFPILVQSVLANVAFTVPPPAFTSQPPASDRPSYRELDAQKLRQLVSSYNRTDNFSRTPSIQPGDPNFRTYVNIPGNPHFSQRAQSTSSRAEEDPAGNPLRPVYSKPDKSIRLSREISSDSSAGIRGQPAQSQPGPAGAAPLARQPSGVLLLHGSLDVNSLPPLSSAELRNIHSWKQNIVSRQQAEQYLLAYTSLGNYLIRGAQDGKGYVLSLRNNMSVFHFRITKRIGSAVAMVDPVNGDRHFNTLEDLIKFFKVYDPEEVGGLEALLTECIPVPPELRNF
eukprot:m.194281 g.194281  ORF g.194281 m.194281 type:complete len:750 (-) comp53701_c0_seq1:192-2441(-)